MAASAAPASDFRNSIMRFLRRSTWSQWYQNQGRTQRSVGMGAGDTWARDTWARDTWARDTWARDTWARDTWARDARDTWARDTWASCRRPGRSLDHDPHHHV